MTSKQITMGTGLVPPEQPFADDQPVAGTARPRARRLLAAAAASYPVLFGAYVAIDPAPLPREPAAEFLGAIAAHPTAYVAATTLQFAAMAAGIVLAVAVSVAFAGRYRLLAPVTSVLLGLGCLGGVGFVGAKLVAADLTADGSIRPDGEAIWTAVQSGPMFDVLSWPLLGAILGSLLLGVLLIRARRTVGLWPGVVVIAGFVLGSGEFPDAVTLGGWLIQVPAFAVVVRRALLR